MQKNTLLKSDGSREDLPTGPLSLEQMYRAIGCDTVELVQLSPTTELWCDENGLYARPLIENKEGTRLYKLAFPREKMMFPEDHDELRIVGNAILSENVDRSDE